MSELSEKRKKLTLMTRRRDFLHRAKKKRKFERNTNAMKTPVSFSESNMLMESINCLNSFLMLPFTCYNIKGKRQESSTPNTNKEWMIKCGICDYLTVCSPKINTIPRIFLTKSDLNEDHKATNLEYKQEIAQLLQGFLFFCKCINFSHFFTMFINVLQSQVVI